MNTRLIFSRFNFLSKVNVYLLALLWGLGILTGTVLVNFLPREARSVFLLALSEKPKPFYVFLINCLPVTITAAALYCRVLAICYPLCLLKAMCHGFCAMLAFSEFGSGAWAIRLLFLFSGCCVCVLMWWLILRHCSDRKPFFAKDIWFAAIMTCFVCLVDIFAIAPFLIRLSMYF